MANKVLIVSPSKLNLTNENLEVWKDIDTVAGDNINHQYVEDVYLKDFVKFLVTETDISIDNPEEQFKHIIPEGQKITDILTDDAGVIQAFAVAVNVGYDYMKDMYDKFMEPYRWKIAKLINVKAVQNSIHNIFTWIPGERILNPEFGSRLRRMLYEGITDLNVEMIMSEIKGTILKYEPRVEIVDVVNMSSTDDTEDNTVHLEIIYKIPKLSDKQYSYSFYYNRTLDAQ